jgi:hypothetical protein
MFFKISPCFKSCCLIQSWVFKYVNKVKNGNSYSYAISLLLHFYHMTTVFPLLYYWCYFSSLHSHSSFPHYVESKIQNIMIKSWQYSVYKQCAFLSQFFTMASTTCNSSEPGTLAHVGLVLNGKPTQKTTAALHTERNLWGE